MSVGISETGPAQTEGEQPLLVIGTIFFFSGATALIYQVAWMRLLSLFFGSDIYAAAITLGVFMAGLSLGGLLAGKLADRARRPLLIYGWIEIGIALYAFVFPSLLASFEPAYRQIYQAYFDSTPALYFGFRLLLAAALILIPTVLMGATLPLLVRQFATRATLLGRRVGHFYAINTMGALCGTLSSGFILIPAWGVSRTVLIAVVVNLSIGVWAIALAARLRLIAAESQSGDGLSQRMPSAGQRERVAILMAMAISGMAALALEVVWMRVLVQSFSATVYAFAIMLACFLFGIFAGSTRASATADRHPDGLRLLVQFELWLAASVALLGIVTYFVPSLFGMLLWGLAGATGGKFGVASVIAQFVVAGVLILAPTVLLGATFPVAVKLYTRHIDDRAEGAGTVYAANTAGALIGTLLGGFILLPTFGAQKSLIAIGALFFLAAIVLWRRRGGVVGRWVGEPSLIVPATVAVVAGLTVVLLPPQTVVNFDLQSSTQPEVLYHGEGVSHTLDLVRTRDGHTIMMINGNVEADTTLVQRRHFILKGHLPLLLHPNPSEVAVVGLGLGITLKATENYPLVRRIRVVELSPQMVAAHAHLGDVTRNLLNSPKIDLRVDDGRNFMAMSAERFDMITADPVHPRITGVGYLYTREYYERIRERLLPGGIVTQWMPMYQISPESFDVAFRTFATVFPHASFWYVRGHGLFVATIDDFVIDYPRFAKRFADPHVRSDIDSIGIASPEQLLGHLLMDAQHIESYLARNESRTLNTDDNAYLEYHTPFEYVGRTEEILTGLLPFAGWDLDQILSGAPDEVASTVQRHFEQRLEVAIPELSMPID